MANTLRQAGVPLDMTLKRRRFFASSMGEHTGFSHRILPSRTA